MMRSMADVLTREQRSRCMSKVRAKNTKPEMIVRRLVHSLGYRYRLHVRTLPGTPDLVFNSRQRIIFINGCFWHQHGCGRNLVPATRREFWLPKLKRNCDRDLAARKQLQRCGWRILVIWECEVKDAQKLAQRIESFLGEHS